MEKEGDYHTRRGGEGEGENEKRGEYYTRNMIPKCPPFSVAFYLQTPLGAAPESVDT